MPEYTSQGECWLDDEYCLEWAVLESADGYQLAENFVSCAPHGESGWEVTPEVPISAAEFRQWITGDESPFDGENSDEIAEAISAVLGMVSSS